MHRHVEPPTDQHIRAHTSMRVCMTSVHTHVHVQYLYAWERGYEAWSTNADCKFSGSRWNPDLAKAALDNFRTESESRAALAAQSKKDKKNNAPNPAATKRVSTAAPPSAQKSAKQPCTPDSAAAKAARAGRLCGICRGNATTDEYERVKMKPNPQHYRNHCPRSFEVRLRNVHNLKPVDVSGDGNCFFRAVRRIVPACLQTHTRACTCTCACVCM